MVIVIWHRSTKAFVVSPSVCNNMEANIRGSKDKAEHFEFHKDMTFMYIATLSISLTFRDLTFLIVSASDPES
jgi:hypothetical protein